MRVGRELFHLRNHSLDGHRQPELRLSEVKSLELACFWSALQVQGPQALGHPLSFFQAINRDLNRGNGT